MRGAGGEAGGAEGVRGATSSAIEYSRASSISAITPWCTPPFAARIERRRIDALDGDPLPPREREDLIHCAGPRAR
jgi:hypothetical protein